MRTDAIVATGRSDYPNKSTTCWASPNLPRRARRARAAGQHGDEDAAARALAELAREDVPDEVAAAYHGRREVRAGVHHPGRRSNPRLISYVRRSSPRRLDTGVARKPIANMDVYREQLAQRLDPTAAFLQKISGAVQAAPNKRIVFAEGETLR